MSAGLLDRDTADQQAESPPFSPRVQRAIGTLLRDRGDDPVCAYLYDLPALRAQATTMRAQLPPGCALFYAAKANAEPPILQALQPLVDGFEIASGGELEWLRAHCPGAPLLFGGPGKLDSDLREALAGDVDAIHAESVRELRRLASIAEAACVPAPVMLRLNLRMPGADATRLVMSGVPSPFGIDEADLAEAMAIVRESPFLHLWGLHVHALSHQLDTDAHLRRIGFYLDCAEEIANRFGVSLPILNCGGGMGVNYQDPEHRFDWPRFCDGLGALLRARGNAPALRFEIGRFIAAGCGNYVMEVLDLKRSHGEWFAVARGGTHHFRLPAAQNHDHPVHVVRGKAPPALRDQAVTVVGQLCTPKDVLCRRRRTAALAVGDMLVLPLAGAYGWTISHRDFLRHPPPQMLFLDEDAS